jgi:methylmalonyl-CoA mutase, N-terminal domain
MDQRLVENAGEFPFTRGISADPHVWVMGQYSGYGTAADTNNRFRQLIREGQTGFSVALDLPTQLGLDSDDPRAAGEVGKIGVAIDSLADVEQLMEDLPLEQMQVRTTANSIGFIWVALLVALAERRSEDASKYRIFIQNDVLKEFFARGTQIFPPKVSLRLSCDVLEYCSQHLPRWVPLAVSGYHIREAGSTAAQEIAFSFSNAVEYFDEMVRRTIPVAPITASIYSFLSSNIRFMDEVAKFRAARQVWAWMLRDRYAIADSDALKLRILVFTAGSSFTAEQPLNNVVRGALEAVAAALGGVQSMHVSAFDEALGIPTEVAATLALRTQQIVAFESGLTELVDALGGSYVLEAKTEEIDRAVRQLLDEIDRRGGALACVESGWFQRQIADSAYSLQQEVESGERIVVGVNRFRQPGSAHPVFEGKPDSEREQVAALAGRREERDSQAVDVALERLAAVARTDANVIAACVECVRRGATVGEIVGALTSVFGRWRPSAEY